MLTSQAQLTMLAISRYLINLLSITGDVYCKMLRPKPYSAALKKYLFGILDYAKVKLFHPQKNYIKVKSFHALSYSKALSISESRIQQSSDSL